MDEIGLIEEVKDDLARVKIAQAGSESAQEGIIWAKNLAGAKIGDKVLIVMPEKNLTKAGISFYLIPLVALFLGAGIGKWISSQKNLIPLLEAKFGITISLLLLDADNPSLILGILALLLAFFLLRSSIQKRLKSSEFQPKVIRVLE